MEGSSVAKKKKAHATTCQIYAHFYCTHIDCLVEVCRVLRWMSFVKILHRVQFLLVTATWSSFGVCHAVEGTFLLDVQKGALDSSRHCNCQYKSLECFTC